MCKWISQNAKLQLKLAYIEQADKICNHMSTVIQKNKRLAVSGYRTPATDNKYLFKLCAIVLEGVSQYKAAAGAVTILCSAGEGGIDSVNVRATT